MTKVKKYLLGNVIFVLVMTIYFSSIYYTATYYDDSGRGGKLVAVIFLPIITIFVVCLFNVGLNQARSYDADDARNALKKKS